MRLVAVGKKRLLWCDLSRLGELYLTLVFLLYCSLYPHLFARAYINFKNPEDIVLFRDRFDGYVFIDSRGKFFLLKVELIVHY